jgi:hypothetical protein
MAWAVSNARVEPRGNPIIITKQASGTLSGLLHQYKAARTIHGIGRTEAEKVADREAKLGRFVDDLSLFRNSPPKNPACCRVSSSMIAAIS